MRRGTVCISARSALLLDGDIWLDALRLDGVLSIRACDGAHVTVRDCIVENDGSRFEAISTEVPPRAVSIRGYAFGYGGGPGGGGVVPGTARGPQKGALHVEVTDPGVYELSGRGVLVKR